MPLSIKEKNYHQVSFTRQIMFIRAFKLLYVCLLLIHFLIIILISKEVESWVY